MLNESQTEITSQVNHSSFRTESTMNFDFNQSDRSMVFASQDDLLLAIRDKKLFKENLEKKKIKVASKESKYLDFFDAIDEKSKGLLDNILKKNTWIIVKKDFVGFKDSTIFDSIWDEKHYLYVGKSIYCFANGNYYQITNGDKSLIKEAGKSTSNIFIKKLDFFNKTVVKNANRLAVTCTSMSGTYTTPSNNRCAVIVLASNAVNDIGSFSGQSQQTRTTYWVEIVGKMRKRVLGLWFYYTPSAPLYLSSRYGYQCFANGTSINSGSRNVFSPPTYNYQVNDYFSYVTYTPTTQSFPVSIQVSESTPKGYMTNADLQGANCYYSCN